MPSFGDTSRARLETCHPSLQAVMNEVIRHFDYSIVCGHRGEAEQMKAFDGGLSKARWLQSPHNFTPSFAVDAVPHPIDWKDTERMAYGAGFIVMVGISKGISLTWGRDWDGDTDLKDQKFNDYPHFELKHWREMT